VRRFDQRQGFLVSAAIHLTLLMILIAHPPAPRRPDEIDPATLERKELVFLPPPSVIRQLAPKPIPAVPAQPAPRAPVPAPAAPTPDPSGKDRISVGPKLPVRNEGPLNLESLGKVPKGTQTERLNAPAEPKPSPPAPAAAPTPLPQVADATRGPGGTAGPPAPGREGLRLPPGLTGRSAAGDEGRRPAPGLSGESVDRAIQDAARRAADTGGTFGQPTGTAADISGLHFDDQGADFTVWLSHLRNEFWRNYVAPQTAYLGFRGRVVLRFTVERDGQTSSLDTVQSSGTASLDRSVAHAISGSRYLPLPSDYRPARVTFHLIFDYR
jgi:TonB family protein